MIIPNIWENRKCSKPPTRESIGIMIPERMEVESLKQPMSSSRNHRVLQQKLALTWRLLLNARSRGQEETQNCLGKIWASGHLLADVSLSSAYDSGANSGAFLNQTLETLDLLGMSCFFGQLGGVPVYSPKGQH